MLALLNLKGLGQADPKSTGKKAAEDCNDDGVGFGLSMLRIVKPWAAVGCFVVRHERTRGRAHAQHYGVDGMPCQRFFLPFAFFFSRLGLALIFATVST